MYGFRKHKWVIIICAVILGGVCATIWGARSHISYVANQVCQVQYDDMLSDLTPSDELKKLLHDGRGAYCECYVDGLMAHWGRYMFMSTNTMALQMITDGATPSYACLDVFADLVYETKE